MKTQLHTILESKFAVGLLFCVFAVLSIPPAFAEDIEQSEKTKIEALLSHVEALSNASFIRNGSEYDSKSAAKFLRGKWQAHAKDIVTAEDFISKVATRSSTTGTAYVIRFKGGADTPCADYLSEQLKKLAAKSATPR